MVWLRYILGVAACLFVWASSASAIVIETAGMKVGGYLVSKDAKRLTIRTVGPGGQEVVNEYSLAKVTILHELDVNRLESLSKSNPKGYSDYADELAKQDEDPEARYMARRLYVIAANLDPQNLGTSSLLRIARIAGSPAEARRCRALAYLLDSKANAKVLEEEEPRAERPTKEQAEALRDFTLALRHYRSGKVKLAIEAASRPGLDRVFAAAPGSLDQRSFRRLCADASCSACKGKGKAACSTCGGKGVVRNMFGGNDFCSKCNGKKQASCDTCGGRGINQDLSDDTIKGLLRAELWATSRLLGGDPAAEKKKAAEARSWSSVLQRKQVSPVPSLTLETLTEFDPKRCQYRGGSWVVPSDR